MSDAALTHTTSAATPARLLRLEGAALLALALFAYHMQGGSILVFVVLLFAPDLSMIGYAAGPRWGATLYNLAHTTIIPAGLIIVGLAAGIPNLTLVALIWLAHIGLDRFLGYGLKYFTAFKDTHFQRL